MLLTIYVPAWHGGSLLSFGLQGFFFVVVVFAWHLLVKIRFALMQHLTHQLQRLLPGC